MPSLSMGPVHLRTTPGWQFFHRYDIATDAFQVFIRLIDYSGKRWAVKPLEFTEIVSGVPVTPNGSLASPIEGVEPDVTGFLQAAMDVAWEIGLRPAGYTDPSTEITAVRYHLEDMRKLAKVKD